MNLIPFFLPNSWVVLDLGKHSLNQYLLIKAAMQDSKTHKQNLEEVRLSL